MLPDNALSLAGISGLKGRLPVYHKDVSSDTGVGKEWLLRGLQVTKDQL